jgi:transcriptional regulator with XRE-family HTH domain
LWIRSAKSIREAREAKAMTPAELAKAANVEREDLEALEAGRLTPAGDFVLALSTGLGIAPDALGGYLDPTAAVAAFGRRLRELRESDGLSRRRLAICRASTQPQSRDSRRADATRASHRSCVSLAG